MAATTQGIKLGGSNGRQPLPEIQEDGENPYLKFKGGAGKNAEQSTPQMTLEQRKALAVAQARLRLRENAQAMVDDGASTAAQAPQWSELPGNILPSAGRAVEGLLEAVTHPAQTLRTLDDAATGGLRKLEPEWLKRVDNAITPSWFRPTPEAEAEILQRQDATASAMGEALKERYGGLDRIKNTVITDPVGSLMDLSALASGGSSLAARAPVAGSQMLSQGLRKAGQMTDPLRLAGKAASPAMPYVGKALSYPLSLTTGASTEAIQMAGQTGLQGGEAAKIFRGAMRGTDAPETILNEAHDALGNMAYARHNEYLGNMRNTAASQAQVDLAPIYGKLDELRRSLQVEAPGLPSEELGVTAGNNAASFGPLAKGSPAEFKALDEIQALVDQWAAHPQGQTPIALDALKQRISRMQPSPTAENAANHRRLVTGMENAVKESIVQAQPSYAKAMADYEAAMNLKKDMEKSLGLSANASTETGMNKLNASLGKEHRSNLLDELSQHGAPNLKARVAGNSLSQVIPKNGVGRIIAAFGGSGGLWTANPFLLASPLLASPRAMAEVAHAFGRGTRKTKSLPTEQIIKAFIASRANQLQEQQ